MIRIIKLLSAIFFTAVLATPVLAQDRGGAVERRPLEVGDAAPTLSIERWVKGAPFDAASSEKPYVVVFNLTTCPSCRKALPYLSQLSRDYANSVSIISVFAHELAAPNDPENITSLNKVNYLLNAMGDRVDMPIGVDGPARTIRSAWNVFIFPSAYLVQEGKVAWIGDPVWLGPVLQQVRDGVFDPVATAKEQEAYHLRVQEARDAISENDFKKGLAIVDSLIAKHPYENSLQFMKYHLLARSGDQNKADAFLRKLISLDPQAFDWDHFVYETYLTPEKPNYELSLAAVDRAIEHAESELVAATQLASKARIYSARSKTRKSREDARADLEKAIECLQQAADLSRSTGDIRDVRLVETELYYYQFRMWSGVNDTKANSYLASVLSGESQRVQWTTYVADALKDQRKPDYQLLLWTADRAYAESYDEVSKAAALASKGDVYAAMKNYTDAIAIYERAIAEAEFSGSDEIVAKYEETLSVLVQNQADDRG